MCSGVYRLHCEGVITTNITRVVGGDVAGLRLSSGVSISAVERTLLVAACCGVEGC